MASVMHDDRLPFHVLVDAEVNGVIDVFEQSAALQIAIIDRGAAKSLTGDWDAPGVYVLLDRHTDDGTWGVYVGKAPAGIRSRIKTHLTGKDHWYRALLIKRDTRHGYNSAHTAWLEGRLYDLLESATLARLHNAQRPGDDTLPSYDLPMLEAAVEPVARLLRVIGHDTSTAEEQGATEGKSAKPAHHGVSMKDLLTAGLIQADAELVSTWATVPAAAHLRANGSIEYAGKTYSTPSGAAIAARGGPTNGWAMWAVKTPTGLVRLATLRTRHLDGKKP